MEAIIVRPKNKAEQKALKAIFVAMKVEFETTTDTYNQDFVDEILKSKEEVKNGKYTTVTIDSLWK